MKTNHAFNKRMRERAKQEKRNEKDKKKAARQAAKDTPEGAAASEVVTPTPEILPDGTVPGLNVLSNDKA